MPLYLKRPLLLLGLFIVAASDGAAAQDPSPMPAPLPSGIRYVLHLAVTSDPNSRFLPRNFGLPVRATLTVKTRISAHSLETNFYGDVPATVSDFDPTKSSREQEIWKETRCHHERGFPKITVINVDGSVTSGGETIRIAARYRWLGLLLPQDEVMPARRLGSGRDALGRFVATRTETKQSHLFIDLKLYTLHCNLADVGGTVNRVVR